MRLELPEYPHDLQTLIAISVGAVLATLGGFLASLFEARLYRRDREKTAALIFGEILTGLRLLILAAEDSHGRGDPFGPLTMRLLRSARRELDAYDRGRGLTSDVRNADLRLKIHGLMSRIAIAVDSMLEATSEAERDASWGYLLTLAPSLDPLVHRLMPLAGQPVAPYETAGFGPDG